MTIISKFLNWLLWPVILFDVLSLLFTLYRFREGVLDINQLPYWILFSLAWLYPVFFFAIYSLNHRDLRVTVHPKNDTTSDNDSPPER
jgi:hypothetical protein